MAAMAVSTAHASAWGGGLSGVWAVWLGGAVLGAVHVGARVHMDVPRYATGNMQSIHISYVGTAQRRGICNKINWRASKGGGLYLWGTV
jgi:hypothetical protein